MKDKLLELADSTWLSAKYHMPLTYSCRAPLASPHSATTLPAPSQATVKLALIRNSIELFGIMQTKEQILPVLGPTLVQVKPPRSISISSTSQRQYKSNAHGKYTETIAYREFAHCHGPITIYLRIDRDRESVELFTTLLQSIGYWGQSNSFAQCIQVCEQEPIPGTCAIMLDEIMSETNVGDYHITMGTYISKQKLTWEDISPSSKRSKNNVIQRTAYIWPLTRCEHHSNGALYQYCSLKQ